MSDVCEGSSGLAERLVAATDWGSYRGATGSSAAGLGDVLLSLLRSDPGGAGSVMDHLENEVVPQANLYDAAEPAVSVLAATLADPRPRWVRIVALDLMFLILTGAPVAQEVEQGNGALLERCIARVRESMWLIAHVALADATCYDAAHDVLDIVDADGWITEFVESVGPS